ncbi:UbiA-like polyprenyltransferase [Paenibacillus sp. CMAA1364]
MFKKIGAYLEMIKIEHTLFTLPFAFMGALLGSVTVHGTLPSWAQIGWIVLALFGARSAAFGLNRMIDQVIDKKNPRTANRAIPAGILKTMEVLLFTIVSFIILFWAAFELTPLSVKLLPIAVFMLVIYSYTKRFTWLCHVVLGLTTSLAALGGWVAVTNSVDSSAFIFYFTLSFWTAGFDIIYAIQDLEFDVKEGIYSIPARFGIHKALVIARVFHLLTAIGFIGLYFTTSLHMWYLIGIVISCGILIYEHFILSPKDMSKLQIAFFTMNSVLSIVVFVFTLVDLVVYTT